MTQCLQDQISQGGQTEKTRKTPGSLKFKEKSNSTVLFLFKFQTVSHKLKQNGRDGRVFSNTEQKTT